MSTIPSIRFRPVLAAVLPFLGFAALTASVARAQPTPRLTVHEVLAAGDPAPGFVPGAPIQAIGDVPRIDADGNVSTVVLVRAADGSNLQALYRALPDPAELVFRAGDPAPDSAGSFVLFPSLPQTPRIHAGSLTFAAEVDAAEGPRAGVWSDRSGAFERLLLAGDHLPGLPADGEVSTFELTTRGTIALLRARFSQGGSSPPGARGLWRNRDGAWQPLVVPGMAAPDVSGGSFGPDPTGAYGTLFAFDARGDGRVLAQAWVTGSRIDQNNDEGLWLETASGLRLLVREGARAAGDKTKTTFGPTLSSPTFGGDNENIPATVNDRGAVLFGAVLRSGKSRLNSVWTTRSGSLELLVRGAVPLSGYGQGDQAPGFAPGVAFATFDQGAIDESNRIAFQGFADEFRDPLNLTQAIWWDVPGRLTLVAAEGRPVPGLPGVTYRSLSLESLTDAGALFFSASLAGSGVGAANDRALLRADPDGSVGHVLREGDIVAVVDPAGITERVVRAFQFGRDLDRTGRGVARLTFGDGSSGVYTTAESLLP